MKRVELAPVPVSLISGLQEACAEIRIFHLANVPYAEDGLLYSGSFQELSSLILKLRKADEEVVVIIDVKGEKEESMIQPLIRDCQTIKVLNGQYVVVGVDPQLLNRILVYGYDFDWAGETMWIAIGSESEGQEIIEIAKRRPIQLLDLVRHFPIIIERGHDAAYLWLYSTRHSLEEVKEILESVLPADRFHITTTDDYRETDWSRSWHKGYRYGEGEAEEDGA